MDMLFPGSFRDPAGYLFVRQGILYRQINNGYKEHYQKLIDSGLYKGLVKKGWLVAHEETESSLSLDGQAYKVIRPEKLDVISYPYEWSFSQLRDAALLTLDIQKMALERGLSLKDASAYNIQFYQGKPIFIDTLSFETLHEGKPWIAYRQFCQHFLAPLALMAKTDISLNQLMANNIDGIPLPLASKLLPWKTWFNLSIGVHIHLHARAQAKNANKSVARQVAQKQFSRHSFLALLESLRSVIKGLHWHAENTEWFDYYDSNNNYQNNAMASKDAIVDAFLQKVPVSLTWDLGANTGRFSRIAARYSKTVCAWDIDPACVELNYLAGKNDKEKKVLPLLLNLANPSPAIGWANEERMSLLERGPADMVLALGLIHHLAIANNVPLEYIAAFLARAGNYLLIEFVPKEDSQVRKLLQNREDIFSAYTEENFEQVFSQYFCLLEKQAIPDSLRTLYLYKSNK